MIENIFYHEERISSSRPFILWSVFLSAFLACVFLFHLLYDRDIYFANYPLWDIKYQYLRDWQQSPDVLFLGSSHIYRHVIPGVIENSLDDHNKKLNVVNLGISDLSVVELNLIVSELKRKKENHESLPSYVVIDPFITTGRVERLKNWSTTRAIKNHTLINTLDLLSFEWYETTPKKMLIVLYHSLSHVLSLCANLLNVGISNEKVFLNQTGYMRSDEAIPDMIVDQGYIALAEETRSDVANRRNKSYQEDTKFYKINIQLNPHYIDYFQSIYNNLDSLGIHVIFISTPVLSKEKSEIQKKTIDAFRKNKPDVLFFDYSDMLIEEQYRNSHFWHDQGHLTLAGAQLFSEKLGDDLNEVIREKIK